MVWRSPASVISCQRKGGGDRVTVEEGVVALRRSEVAGGKLRNHGLKFFAARLNHPPTSTSSTPTLAVVVGRPLPGNRNDCKAWEESEAEAAVVRTTSITDGGCPGTGLIMPFAPPFLCEKVPGRKREHSRSHKQVRARVEHVLLG